MIIFALVGITFISCVNSDDVTSTSPLFSWKEETNAAQWNSRVGHSDAVFAGKMWVIGGRSGGTGYFNDVWSSADGATWTKITESAPWTPRSGLASVEFDAGTGNKIWIIGGNINSVRLIGTNDVWSYSLQ